MTLKKKLTVSAVVLGLTTATFVGFPFGGPSAANPYALVKVAKAEGTSNLEYLQNRVNELYTQLSDSDKETLRKLREELQAITESQFETALAPVLTKPNLDLTVAEQNTLYDLFEDVSTLYYSEDLSNVAAIRTNTAYTELLKSIGAKAGVTNLTVDDVFLFAFGNGGDKPGVEGELVKLVQGLDVNGLLALYHDPSKSEELVKKAFDAIVTQDAGGYTLSTVLDYYGVTSDDLLNVAHNVNGLLSYDDEAAKILATAYVATGRLATSTPSPTATPSTGSGSGGGGTTTSSTPTPSATPGKLDVSKFVVINNGVATLQVTDATVIAAIDALAASATDKSNLTLTLDLGTVDAKTVVVPLSQAIIDVAKAKGVANIAVTFNGVTITLPITQFSGAVTLKTSVLDNSTVTSLTSLKLASDVYEFGVTADGKATTIFKLPITIRLPLKNIEGLDKELLSVTKIVGNSLQFQGGLVDSNFIVEPRDSFSSYAVLENKVTFTDTASVQSWAGRQIGVVAAKGAIEGVGSGKFAPKANVTRAEFAKMLVRALDLDNQTAVSTFGDVKSTEWFAPYVAVAAEKGIINGRTATAFDPTATITRAEMATMISRALKSVHNLPDSTVSLTALNSFSDASKISASLKDGVAFAASNNLIIGNAGKYNPNSPANRAEAAVIIYRTINFK